LFILRRAAIRNKNRKRDNKEKIHRKRKGTLEETTGCKRRMKVRKEVEGVMQR